MTLVVCEKNNAAKRISYILSEDGLETKRKYKRPYYSFYKDNVKYDVIGLRGHIVALDYPKKYNSWYAVKPKDLVFIEPIKVKKARNIIRALGSLSRDHDQVIVATDYDREGELIGKEALDIIKKKNETIREERIRFSSLTKSEIESAFSHPAEMDWNLTDAAFTRQYIDLVWGASLTRFLSLTTGNTGKDFLSVGRVQTPTLALIVEKEKEIDDFDPKKYWVVKAELEKGVGPDDEDSDKFWAKHRKKRFWKKEEMQRVMEKVEDAETAEVVGVDTKKRYKYPPPPFNTTMFLRDGTKLRMSASKVMSTAERLYTEGYISYPRTDNTVYPKSLYLKGILKKFTGHPEYGKFVEEILGQEKIIPSRGKKKTTDHPPIYPTSMAKPDKLKGDDRKIYDLVVRRFFATLGEKCVYEKGRFDLDIRKETFFARSVRILKPGWTGYYKFGRVKAKALPPMEAGDIVDVRQITSKEKETQPPRRYKQGSLIGKMEGKGLGTKSTRHGIIKKLFDRNFIKGNFLQPTLIGRAVIEAMEKYSEPITHPDMTSKLEEDMDAIADGKMGWEEVAEESREMLAEIFEVLDKNRKKIRENVKEALFQQRVLGSCTECGDKIVIRRSRRGKRFAGCNAYPKCENSYPLPQRGRIVSTEKTCSECGSPVIKVLKKGSKPWVICINMGCKGNE